MLPDTPSFEFVKDDVHNTYEMWVLKDGQPTMLGMLDQSLGNDVRYAFQFKKEIWLLLNVTPNIEPMPLLEHHDRC